MFGQRNERAWFGSTSRGRTVTALAGAALMLLPVGCKRSSGGSPLHGHDRIAIEDALGRGTVYRDPNQIRPNAIEAAALHAFDLGLEAFTFDAGFNGFYDLLIDDVADAVGIDFAVRIEVAEDFRLDRELEEIGGGVAGHRYILLDGKFLDILWEYSAFLALWEHGIVERDPVEALDEIGFLHNEYFGATTEGFIYPFDSLGDFLEPAAEAHFRSFLGSILYHEFGHVFLYHALDTLRRIGHVDLDHLDALEEDDADAVAGMLLRKADFDLGLGLEMQDILAYYATQRWDREFTYDIVLGGAFQNEQWSDRYSSLSIRKDHMILGWDRFDHWWFD